MSRETVDSVLKSISSLELDNAVSASYTDVADSIRESGAPSNNTLLTIILSEIRRGNDETARLVGSIKDLNESINNMSTKLSESMDEQNTILASMKISSGDKPQQQKMKGKAGSDDWFYKGSRLSSKHHVFACIISQLMSIVQLHIDNRGIQYPDSVDCEFSLMVTMVRVVSSVSCKANNVEYRAKIQLKSVGDQAFDTIYPFVASQDQQFPATLLESSVSQMINPITRDVMQEVEYIRERLCLLECIFSARQIDILRSIKFPFAIDEKLNWDASKIRPRSSHPKAQEIMMLASKQKEAYAIARLNGKSIIDSHDIAVNTKKT